MARRTYVAWSGGKDCAYALHLLRDDPEFDVVGLVTIMTEPDRRVFMHEISAELVQAQARALNLPLTTASVPKSCSDAEFRQTMQTVLEDLGQEGIEAMAYGDIFLEDVRDFREDYTRGSGIIPLFPLWGMETGLLWRQMLDSGFSAVVVSVDPTIMPGHLAGQQLDEAFFQRLPADVDPCGERGEYHSFVCDAPMFSQPLAIAIGSSVKRHGFIHTELKIE